MLVSSPAALSCRACAGGFGRLRFQRARSVRAGVLGLAALFCLLIALSEARGQFPIRQVPERWTGASPVGVTREGETPAEPHAAQANAAAQTPHPAVARITVPEKDGVSYGSGTLIDARGKFGLVVTNWHVVRDAAGPITVEFPEGHKSQAEVIRTDKDWDLAALSILRPRAEPLPITAQAPQIGEWLSIAGYGGGQFRAAAGFVRAYNSPSIDLPQEFIELSAEARHGDSGGPILNQRGEVCGVLFGSAPGYTCGAYGGRVREFLATVIPGGEPGSDTTSPIAAPPITAPSIATPAADPTAIARTEMGPPRNYIPPQPQPQATALHQSPPPYVVGPIDKEEASLLTPAQLPAAPTAVEPQAAIDERLAVSLPTAGVAEAELSIRPSRVHAPVPPRAGSGSSPVTDINAAPSDQLLAAAWQRFGGTTLYDQAKSVLAILGTLAVAVQLWRFTSRREADEE